MPGVATNDATKTPGERACAHAFTDQLGCGGCRQGVLARMQETAGIVDDRTVKAGHGPATKCMAAML